MVSILMLTATFPVLLSTAKYYRARIKCSTSSVAATFKSRTCNSVTVILDSGRVYTLLLDNGLDSENAFLLSPGLHQTRLFNTPTANTRKG
jgi:hypothetical protein